MAAGGRGCCDKVSARSRGSRARTGPRPHSWGTRSCLRRRVPSWVCQQVGRLAGASALCPVPAPGLAEEPPVLHPPPLGREESSVCTPSGGRTPWVDSVQKKPLREPALPTRLSQHGGFPGTGLRWFSSEPLPPPVPMRVCLCRLLPSHWNATCVGRGFAGLLSAQTVPGV